MSLIDSYIVKSTAAMLGNNSLAFQVPEVVREIPDLRGRLKELDSRTFPHLHAQGEFLLDYVDDCFENRHGQKRPCDAFDEAVFAVSYLFRRVDFIPDFIPGLGHLDDSAIVRSVLRRHAETFQTYAQTKGADWAALMVA